MRNKKLLRQGLVLLHVGANKQTQHKFLKPARWRENKPTRLLLRGITGNRKTVTPHHSWEEGMSGYAAGLKGLFPQN